MITNSHLIHELSILHREELIRQSNAHRLRRLQQSGIGRRRRLRNHLGGWLIATGERLRGHDHTLHPEENHHAATTNHLAV